MKLYLAYRDTSTMMDGNYSDVYGVFDTEKNAWKCLKKTLDYENSKQHKKDPKMRVYHFDGELSYYWYVKEVELNKELL